MLSMVPIASQGFCSLPMTKTSTPQVLLAEISASKTQVDTSRPFRPIGSMLRILVGRRIRPHSLFFNLYGEEAAVPGIGEDEEGLPL